MSVFRISRKSVWGLQLWQALGEALHNKGKRVTFIEGKGNWEGYSKPRVPGLSLAEFLPEEKGSLSSCWDLLLSFGVRAPLLVSQY